MPFTPPTPRVFEELADAVAGKVTSPYPSISAPIPPSFSGGSIRQRKISNRRENAKATRNIISWLVPEVGIVQMYINPRQITYNDKKHIQSSRTKGGYLLQYWGEELGSVSLSGTTGSSGIEGINVLYDIYRAEQLAFDPFALITEANLDKSDLGDSFFGGVNADTASAENAVERLFAGDSVTSILGAASQEALPETRSRPTLASLAFSVEMYYAGWVFRGYFVDFKVDESAEKIGLFEYTATFQVTQRRGIRLNFFPWHRSAVNGPSNSDPTGPAHSYSGLIGREKISGNNAT